MDRKTENIQLDPETVFLSGLIELQYGQHDTKKLTKAAQKISWAQGWPDDKKAFWNAEAFMWSRKIKKEKRQLIEGELAFLSNGTNLDLGCGAYSYLPSVGFDLSEKMLQFNDNCHEKVVGDLEDLLPFPDDKFDSITAVFVFNYVNNYNLLFREIKRLLKSDGIFMMILSSKQINDWQGQKEVSQFSLKQWTEILKKSGFLVKFYEKEGLWFFKCN